MLPLFEVPEWQAMKDAQEAGVDVVAIANPCSGPGTEEDRPSYELGMEALNNSGVEASREDAYGAVVEVLSWCSWQERKLAIDGRLRVTPRVEIHVEQLALRALPVGTTR